MHNYTKEIDVHDYCAICRKPSWKHDLRVVRDHLFVSAFAQDWDS